MHDVFQEVTQLWSVEVHRYPFSFERPRPSVSSLDASCLSLDPHLVESEGVPDIYSGIHHSLIIVTSVSDLVVRSVMLNAMRFGECSPALVMATQKNPIRP